MSGQPADAEARRGADRDAAVARLAASRARLSKLLLPPLEPSDASPAGGPDWAAPRRWRALWRLLGRRGPLAPVVRAAGHGLAGWWQRQPWRQTAGAVGELGAAHLRPLIRSHPLAAIGVGAASGALLAATQPWRWRALRVHATRSRRQVLAWAAGQLTQPAVQLLLAGLLVSKGRRSHAAAEAVALAWLGLVGLSPLAVGRRRLQFGPCADR